MGIIASLAARVRTGDLMKSEVNGFNFRFWLVFFGLGVGLDSSGLGGLTQTLQLPMAE